MVDSTRDALTGAEDSGWGRSRRLATAILSAALLLCAFLSLRAGSAYPHVDETQVVGTSLVMERGEPKPPQANWPSHTYHLLRLERDLLRRIDLLPDREVLWESFRTSWYRDITPLHHASRALALLFALLTLLATYRLGRTALDRVPAASATLLVASSPLFVNYSAFALTDMPHAFWTTTAVWLAAFLARKKHLGKAFLAGLATSLAVASKYLGGIAAFAVIAAWAWPGAKASGRWNGTGRAFFARDLVFLGALVGLGAGMPDAFLRFETPDGCREWGFERYLGWLSTHAEATDWTWFGFEGSPSGWEQALTSSLPHAAGTVWLLALAGLGWLLLLVQRTRVAGTVLLFGLLYFGVVGRNDILYTRYWLPFVPLIGVGVAALLQLVQGRSGARSERSVLRAGGGPRTVVALSLLLAGAVWPAWVSLRWANRIHAGDTRFAYPDEFAEWEGSEQTIELLATGHPHRSEVPGFSFLHNPAYPRPEAGAVELGVARHRHPDDLVLWLTFLQRLAEKRSLALEALWAQVFAQVQDLEPILSEDGIRFATPERFYAALWRIGVRHYLWSEFVDGVYRDLGREHHPNFQRFLDLVERGKVVLEIDPGGTPRDDLPLVEAEALLSSRLNGSLAGPRLKLYELVEPPSE